MNDYDRLINKLKSMDEKQLIELFHDIEDINVVERIADVAYHFVENYPYISESNDTGQSEYAEAKEIDDARRLREHK